MTTLETRRNLLIKGGRCIAFRELERRTYAETVAFVAHRTACLASNGVTVNELLEHLTLDIAFTLVYCHVDARD